MSDAEERHEALMEEVENFDQTQLVDVDTEEQNPLPTAQGFYRSLFVLPAFPTVSLIACYAQSCCAELLSLRWII